MTLVRFSLEHKKIKPKHMFIFIVVATNMRYFKATVR